MKSCGTLVSDVTFLFEKNYFRGRWWLNRSVRAISFHQRGQGFESCCHTWYLIFNGKREAFETSQAKFEDVFPVHWVHPKGKVYSDS